MAALNPTPQFERVKLGDAQGLFNAYVRRCREWRAQYDAAIEAAHGHEQMTNVENGVRYARPFRHMLTLRDMDLFGEIVAECYRSLPDDVPGVRLEVEVGGGAALLPQRGRSVAADRIRNDPLESTLTDWGQDEFPDPDTGVGWDCVKLKRRRVSGVSKAVVVFETNPLVVRGVHAYDEFNYPVGQILIGYDTRATGGKYDNDLLSAGWEKRQPLPAWRRLHTRGTPLRRPSTVEFDESDEEWAQRFLPPDELQRMFNLMPTNGALDPPEGCFIQWKSLEE